MALRGSLGGAGPGALSQADELFETFWRFQSCCELPYYAFNSREVDLVVAAVSVVVSVLLVSEVATLASVLVSRKGATDVEVVRPSTRLLGIGARSEKNQRRH